MSNLFPMMAGPECFKPGDCVRKFVTMSNVTPFCGIVTQVAPVANKVWVQWPVEHVSESPETLIKVNPIIFGLPTVTKDHGYSSYEKDLSEKLYGKIPKKASGQEKSAIRIAHTFANEVVGRLVNDIVDCRNRNLKDVQAYNRIYAKYSNFCSDYIIRSSVKKVYSELANDADKPCPERKSSAGSDLRKKAIQLIIDVNKYFYSRIPDMKQPIAMMEKALAKEFDLTERELVEAGFPKDMELFTRG